VPAAQNLTDDKKGMVISMEFGVQIFGCMSDCKKDPEQFFKTLAEAGYHQIEPCVLFDDPRVMAEKARSSGNEFMERLAENLWKPEELPFYIKLMNQYGLELSSVHVFAEDVFEVADKMIETAKMNKISAYAVNCNQETITEDYITFAEDCRRLSIQLREHNIELWIHNNGAEIKNKVKYQGRQVPILSVILEQCKEAGVGAQIDVGWVLYGGVDPVSYLLEVKDYVRSVHFKDLKKDFATRHDGDIFACLGDGALDVRDILGCMPQLKPGTTVLIDQDASDDDIMEDMRTSYKVLTQAL
jgi:sugar phosphate isomerase/epimerase